MKDLIFAPKKINFVSLDQELREVLREVIYGLSASDSELVVHLSDDVTFEQQEQVQAMVLAHNPAQLTSRQQALVQQQEQLEQLRQATVNPLDLSLYEEEADMIRQLAQKVAWLELEFRVGRGQ